VSNTFNTKFLSPLFEGIALSGFNVDEHGIAFAVKTTLLAVLLIMYFCNFIGTPCEKNC
jgi:hypothetical protein